MTTFKNIKDSETIFTELMIPAYANFGGKVHGGILLSLMDKVAQIKSNQQANAIFNGSTISSDIIISTEQNGKGITTSSLEVIREQTMGFVKGLIALMKFDHNGKKVFVYYQAINPNH